MLEHISGGKDKKLHFVHIFVFTYSDLLTTKRWATTLSTEGSVKDGSACRIIITMFYCITTFSPYGIPQKFFQTFILRSKIKSGRNTCSQLGPRGSRTTYLVAP